MSKLTEKIFAGKNNHYLTSGFGKRAVLSTSSGSTSSFHSGCDYGTNNKKIKQYAVAAGSIISCGKDKAEYGKAKYIWVQYPDLGVKMLHYHLDSIKVKKGQKVKAGTLLGTTGKTGKATGIHLHLGIKSLDGGDYIDPEKWSSQVYEALTAAAEYKVGNYRVTADLLCVREGPDTSYKKLTYRQMTSSAQKKIKEIRGKAVDGYVKGLTFTALEIKGEWGRTPSGWVCLRYCERL